MVVAVKPSNEAYYASRNLLRWKIRRTRPHPMDAYELPSQFFRSKAIIWRPGEKGLHDYQLDAIDAPFAIKKRVAFRGPHTAGKTMLASALASFCALKWEAEAQRGRINSWMIVTTASVWMQLQFYLWPAIHRWFDRFNWREIGFAPWDLNKWNYETPYGNFFAVAPEKLEGAHADRMLWLLDESKDIPDITFEKMEGAFAGSGPETEQRAYAMAISTPGPKLGKFYRIHAQEPGNESWYPIHVTLADTIRVGRLSRTWAEERKLEWGEDSAVYQNRVLGNFATQDAEGIIPLSWVEAANRRWIEREARIREGLDPLGPLSVIGADLADEGQDDTVFAPRFGMFVDKLRYYKNAKPMQTAGRLFGILSKLGGRAVVDVLPNGSAIADNLSELAVNASVFNGSERATYTQGDREVWYTDRSGTYTFVNRRSHALWNIREMLDPSFDPELCLPPDNRLLGDLTTPKYREHSGARIMAESKDDFKKRLGRSPDAGDATMIACYPVREDEVTTGVGVTAIAGTQRRQIR